MSKPDPAQPPSPSTADDRPRLSYTQVQAAELLGVDVRTLRRWTKAGKLHPARPAGGVVLYAKQDLERLLGSGRADPAAPDPGGVQPS